MLASSFMYTDPNSYIHVFNAKGFVFDFPLKLAPPNYLGIRAEGALYEMGGGALGIYHKNASTTSFFVTSLSTDIAIGDTTIGDLIATVDNLVANGGGGAGNYVTTTTFATAMAALPFTFDVNGNLTLQGNALPAADPHVAGRIWLNDGQFAYSYG